MAPKALLTPGDTRTAQLTNPRDALQALGFEVEFDTPGGLIVSAPDDVLVDLERSGWRVKRLPDRNLVHIGRYAVDAAGREEPPIPTELDVPPSARADWPHHVIHLAGPSHAAWIDELEDRGIDVVAPLGPFGLGVHATAARLKGVRALPWVTAIGPIKPAYRVSRPSMRGDVGLAVGIYPEEETLSVRRTIEGLGGTIVKQGSRPGPNGGAFGSLRVSGVDAAIVARIPSVWWVDPISRIVPLGERESQIVAGHLDGVAAPDTAPVVGYGAWLNGVGLTGAGVTVAIVDTGVELNADNNTSAAHGDLRGRQVSFIDYTAGTEPTDTHGHGTFVAGIAVGNGATAQAEGVNSFLWGHGVAPGASYVTQNLVAYAHASWEFETVFEDTATSGAHVMNNSWGFDYTGNTGYNSEAAVVDARVRDSAPGTAGAQPLIIVSAAGDSGGFSGTIISPHDNKNSIVVGSSLNSRPATGFPTDDIRGIAPTSSRGVLRILPTVVAPGIDVASALSQTAPGALAIAGTGTPHPSVANAVVDGYMFGSGTSAACAHVSGVAALIVEWWRNRTGGRTPSPAMVKALLVNGADDLAGGQNWRCLNGWSQERGFWQSLGNQTFDRILSIRPTRLLRGETELTRVATAAAVGNANEWFHDGITFGGRITIMSPPGEEPTLATGALLHALDAVAVEPIPNTDQGWGRVNLRNVVEQYPASNRGNRVFSDQKNAFTQAGQQYRVTVAPVDTAHPMRVTLVWTDAATVTQTIAPLANDLDLEVTELQTGNVFKGNVFANGFSATGGGFDDRNTVECVYIQAPVGSYDVRVIAAVIAGSAHPDISTPWQDFALVVENADVPQGNPVSVAVSLDRSGSMDFFGYTNTARVSAKAFVNLMGVTDAVGVTSFGSNSTVDFADGAGAVRPIADQSVKDQATAVIDGLGFGGCTFMGAGIQSAGALLSTATTPKAIVLMSDGYDNKGCQQADPNRPSAAAAAQALPNDVRLFACAMGPASDQDLLESIAVAAGGRYYYMPHIDDLFEIYNYIRGQVGGDALAVNDSATASHSVMPALIDSTAECATFSICWSDAAKVRYVNRDPCRPGEVSVRLRDPRGRLIPFNASFVRRQEGAGYVVFRIDEPAPGLWHIEVRTVDRTHLRYTAAVFLRSPIRLGVTHSPLAITLGQPFEVTAVIEHGSRILRDVPTIATISRPAMSVKQLLEKHRAHLRELKPTHPGGDSLPEDVAKLLTLQRDVAGCEGIFDHRTMRVKMRPSASGQGTRGRFATDVAGSYHVSIAARGTLPRSGERFQRKDAFGVFVR
jgi:subtilisin family serine protease